MKMIVSRRKVEKAKGAAGRSQQLQIERNAIKGKIAIDFAASERAFLRIRWKIAAGFARMRGAGPRSRHSPLQLQLKPAELVDRTRACCAGARAGTSWIWKI